MIAQRSGSVRPSRWGEGDHGAQEAEGLFAFVYGFCVAGERSVFVSKVNPSSPVINRSRTRLTKTPHRMMIHSRPARSILPHVSLSSRNRRARYAAALLLDVASSARKGSTLSMQSVSTLLAAAQVE